MARTSVTICQLDMPSLRLERSTCCSSSTTSMPAQVQRRRLADQRGEAHAGAGHRLLAVELGAAEAALELEHDPADAAVADEQVVAAADHLDGQPLLLREASARRMSSTSCGTMKKSAGPPMRRDVWKLRGSLNRTSPRISPSMPTSSSTRRAARPSRARSSAAELAHVAGAQGEDEIPGPGGLAQEVEDARAVAAHVVHLPVAVGRDALGEARACTPGIGASPAA